MVGISRLYFGFAAPGDRLRYASHGVHRRPVVVWNVTRSCNLACRHCYASALFTGTAPEKPGEKLGTAPEKGELSHGEALRLIDSLSEYSVPVVLFSGGEPFMRKDVLELVAYAKKKGIRVTFSTNGTLIDDGVADRIAEIGVGYIGVSIDGGEEVHDSFRGFKGAYKASIGAIRRLIARGVKTGLRVTLTKSNIDAIPGIFELMIDERIPRVCFYHLVPSGRGALIADEGLSREETRAALEGILAGTKRAFERGQPLEVLTVDNPSDGPWLVEKMRSEGNPRAAEAESLLLRNGGSSSGAGIACISWDGTVYPDQFSRNHPVGSVRERPFAEIWDSPPEGSVLWKYRTRSLLPEKCLTCKWLKMCGGSFRARAEAATGSLCGEDPSCVIVP